MGGRSPDGPLVRGHLLCARWGRSPCRPASCLHSAWRVLPVLAGSLLPTVGGPGVIGGPGVSSREPDP